PPPPCTSLFPYTTLFRSGAILLRCRPAVKVGAARDTLLGSGPGRWSIVGPLPPARPRSGARFRCDRARGPPAEPERTRPWPRSRSEEHTSELESLRHLVC